MKTKAFFGESGLTSTSANHYANLAKEANRVRQNYLANVQFYTESINIIGDASAGGVIRDGMNAAELPKIESAISEISQLNALIAFFREAIKEKERLAAEAESWNDLQMREEFEQRRKELELRKPTRAKYITEDDVRNEWSVGEQEKYLSLEAEASAIGKFIHEDGSVSIARVGLMQKMSQPKSVDINGRDTIIHTYEPTVGVEDVDEMFFRLQNRHREVQSELNGMKKRVLDAVEDYKIKVDAEYRLALESWSKDADSLARELQTAKEEESAERVRRQQAVAGLKIVVPNRLKSIFDSLKK